jgi:phosphoribosylamine--glycine ligase
MLKRVEDEIIKPTLGGMFDEGRTYTGCLYCGLMITKSGPKVIEFNCRFGDPETQVVLPLISSDFFELLYLSSINNLSDYNVEIFNMTAVCVIMASKGYPDAYEINKQIFALDKIDEEKDHVVIFHAGTKIQDGKVLTSGGRVLGITAFGEANDLKGTIAKTYNSVKKISYEGAYYRTDIGLKGLKY